MSALSVALLLIIIGLYSATAITEGDEIPWRDVGYVVKIFARERRTNDKSLSPITTCSGTIVSPRLVMADPSCIRNATTFKDFNDILIVILNGESRDQLKIKAKIVEKSNAWALLKLSNPLGIDALCSKKNTMKLARLSLKFSLTHKPMIDIDENELQHSDCWITGFKTSEFANEFFTQRTLARLDIESLKLDDSDSKDHFLKSTLNNNQSVCFEDYGAPITCQFAEGEYQVGFLSKAAISTPDDPHSIFDNIQNASNRRLALCSVLNQITVTSIVRDDHLFEAIERHDLKNFIQAYLSCNF